MREREDAIPIATVWEGVSDLKIELRWSAERQRGCDSVIVALPSSQSHQCARFGVLPTTNLHILQNESHCKGGEHFSKLEGCSLYCGTTVICIAQSPRTTYALIGRTLCILSAVPRYPVYVHSVHD